MITGLDIMRIVIAVVCVAGAALAIERDKLGVSIMLSTLGLLAVAAIFA